MSLSGSKLFRKRATNFKVDNDKSFKLSFNAGIPQGFALGPILFCANDLATYVQTVVEIYMQLGHLKLLYIKLCSVT